MASSIDNQEIRSIDNESVNVQWTIDNSEPQGQSDRAHLPTDDRGAGALIGYLIDRAPEKEGSRHPFLVGMRPDRAPGGLKGAGGRDEPYGGQEMLYQSCTAIALAVFTLGPAQDTEESLLAAARAADARPYELRENGRINGAIYTRLIRVAIAARAAADDGRSLAASDLRGALADESVYVLLRWSAQDTERARARADGRILPLRVGIVPGVYPPTESNLVRPLWSTEDLSLLREFGASTPFSDAAILAAFPREALKAGSFLMAYMQQQEEPLHVGPYSSVRGALITQADVAAWR